MTDRYTQEEIQEIADNYANALKSGIEPTADMTREMKDAAVGIKGYTAAVESAKKQFVSSLSKTAGDLGTAMYKGTKGAGVLGDAAEQAGTALEVMILAIPGIGLAAKAAAVAIGLFAKGVNMAAKQSDALYKSYQELGKSGQGAAGGITDVFNSMQKLGYGIEELDSAVKLLTGHSTDLATFSGTAASGAQAFADSMKGITHGPFLEEMMNLGKTVDDLNAAGASYVKQQVLMGRSQRDIQGTQTERTMAYIKSLDTLQRLTGQSAEALEKQQEEALDDDAYNIYMERLEQSGKAGQEQAQKIKESLAMLDPSIQKLARAGIGGNVGAQGELMNMMPNFIKDLRDQNMSRDQTLANANRDLITFKDRFGDNYMQAADSMEGFGVHVTAINKTIGQTGNLKEREAYAAKEKEMHDKATENLTQTQIAQMNTRDSLQGLVQLGVAPATSALGTLAEVVDDLTSLLPGSSSKHKNDAVATSGGKVGTKGGRSTATMVGAAGGAMAGAELGGEIGLAFGGVGAIPGAAIGGALGGILGGIAGNLGYGTFGGDKGVGKTAGAETAMTYFQSQGWTKEQAAGIVGNLQAESGPSLNPKAVGDNGQAYGIAQWHPDRQAIFKQQMQKDIKESSLEEQLRFVQWELSNTEMVAGNALHSAKAANEAAQIFDRMYERSSGTTLNKRMANANTLAEKKAEFGGIVRARPGGTNILAGEAGDDEAFVPLRGGKIPVDIKNSSFIKEFTRDILGNIGMDQPQRSGVTAREGVENLRLLLPEFSRAISGSMGNIQEVQAASIMSSVKTTLDNFVKTKMPNPGDFAGSSVLPNFNKALPETDTATMLSDRTDKLTQQLAKLEKLPVAAGGSDNSQQLALMSQQLNKLDELVRVMNSQLNVSGKILAYQH